VAFCWEPSWKIDIFEKIGHNVKVDIRKMDSWNIRWIELDEDYV
jgi:hypothetical protein